MNNIAHLWCGVKGQVASGKGCASIFVELLSQFFGKELSSAGKIAGRFNKDGVL